MAAVDPIEREKYAGVAEKPETEWKTGTKEKWLVDRTHHGSNALQGGAWWQRAAGLVMTYEYCSC